jgi:hypothetical protein
MTQNRPPALEIARIQSRYTHALVTSEGADGLNVFLDGALILPGQVESLTIDIVAPTDDDAVGQIAAVLVYDETTDGQKQARSVSLFPGTIEVIARGRRISVTCAEANAFDGLWLGIGLNTDGTATELTGVQNLRVVLSPGLNDAKLTWTDGSEEPLF